jgi:signal transduction histidine kinase
VRQAVKVVKANAGALGIVNTTERTLEIVAIFGYSPDEYPDGAEGLSWPLDKGIIKRVVMRTRSADLVPDVSIDPDYDGGLTGSLSQITVPMLSGREVNAVLILEKRDMPRFNLPDWAFAQRIAEHASIAISNAQLYSALTAANDSKSEFMGFAAHELKNPLTPVMGYIGGMRQGMMGNLSDPMKNVVEIVYNNVKLMDRIINDLRDAARMDANRFELDKDKVKPTRMYDVIEQSAQPFADDLAQKEQTFLNNIPSDLALVHGDAERLVQVFTNLISNANKYSLPSTTIRAEGTVVPYHTTKQGQRLGTMVRISIIDQGRGMMPEDIAKLGKDSYFRSSNEEAKKEKGTGLGMKLTFGLIESHKGLVEVESEFGKGTTFHIYLPLAEQNENAAETAIKPGAD